MWGVWMEEEKRRRVERETKAKKKTGTDRMRPG